MSSRGKHALSPIPTDPRSSHPEPAADPRRERLEALQTALQAATDLRVRVLSPSRSGTGTITLRVINPHAGHLAEDIGCDLLDGAWWFTWPLNDSGTLGPAEDIDGAVNAINHVLGLRM
jgi:hypothetical protein